ncbi:hypothetical protein OROHE_005401 [Orobanche hederae]
MASSSSCGLMQSGSLSAAAAAAVQRFDALEFTGLGAKVLSVPELDLLKARIGGGISDQICYKTIISDSDYTEFENFTKWLGASQ